MPLLGKGRSMARNYDDIDEIIEEIEHIKLNLNDHLLGSVFWEEAMKSLIEKKGSQMIDLLKELRRYRDHDKPLTQG